MPFFTESVSASQIVHLERCIVGGEITQGLEAVNICEIFGRRFVTFLV